MVLKMSTKKSKIIKFKYLLVYENYFDRNAYAEIIEENWHDALKKAYILTNEYGFCEPMSSGSKPIVES